MTTTTTSTTTTRAAHRRGGDGGVLLADALSANAVFSTATAVTLLVGWPWLDDVLGVHAVALVGLGAGLLAFAAAIVVALARPAALVGAARGVVVADLAWVAAALLVLPTDLLSPTDDVVLVLVTTVVGVVAAAQVAGLRRAGAAPRPGVRDLALTGRRDVAATVAQAWVVVADAAGYAEVAPGIAETTTDGDVADGMTRRCVDDGGRAWSETCTVLAPGRAYRMDVDTTTYPMRHRLVFDRLAMRWRVEPRAGGSTIELAFVGGVKLGLLGRAAVAMMTRDAPHELVLDRTARRLSPGGGDR